MKSLKNLINKFSWALLGVKHGLLKDKSILTQMILMLITIITGFIVKLSKYDWIIIIIMCALVVAVEFLNSSIENLSDYVSNKNYSKEIGVIKDLAAAAVLVVSIAALVVGIIVFRSYLF